MAAWFWFGIGAAVLYGLHQVFTKLASGHIDSATGALVVETSAAASILVYLLVLKATHRLTLTASTAGLAFSVLTGVCVGAGTVLFFLLFQKGGPFSAVPAILAGGAALMALVGVTLLREPFQWQRALAIVLSLAALYLLHSAPRP